MSQIHDEDSKVSYHLLYGKPRMRTKLTVNSEAFDPFPSKTFSIAGFSIQNHNAVLIANVAMASPPSERVSSKQ
jgi:hypothetical protein